MNTTLPEHLTQTPENLFADAYTYIFIIFMGTGATILYNMAASILRSLGDSRTPLYFLIVATVINVALDILFMGPMNMGVAGAAWATVIAQLFSGFACLVYMGTRVSVLRLSWQDLRPNGRELAHIAGIGVPMGLQFSITAIGSVTMQSAVNSLGDAAVAGASAGSKINVALAAPMETLGLAMATFCGQNLGAGRVDRIRIGMRHIFCIGLVYCVAALVVTYFFTPSIALLFISAEDAYVITLTHHFMMILTMAYPALLVIFLFRNGLQGMGFSNSAMLAGVAEMIARIAAAFTLVNFWGFTGGFIDHAKRMFPQFLEGALQDDPLKREFYLPAAVEQLLEEGAASVKVLRSSDQWFGVTYREDKPTVVRAIAALTAQELYPDALWSKTP